MRPTVAEKDEAGIDDEDDLMTGFLTQHFSKAGSSSSSSSKTIKPPITPDQVPTVVLIDVANCASAVDKRLPGLIRCITPGHAPPEGPLYYGEGNVQELPELIEDLQDGSVEALKIIREELSKSNPEFAMLLQPKIIQKVIQKLEFFTKEASEKVAVFCCAIPSGKMSSFVV